MKQTAKEYLSQKRKASLAIQRMCMEIALPKTTRKDQIDRFCDVFVYGDDLTNDERFSLMEAKARRTPINSRVVWLVGGYSVYGSLIDDATYAFPKKLKTEINQSGNVYHELYQMRKRALISLDLSLFSHSPKPDGWVSEDHLLQIFEDILGTGKVFVPKEYRTVEKNVVLPNEFDFESGIIVKHYVDASNEKELEQFHKQKGFLHDYPKLCNSTFFFNPSPESMWKVIKREFFEPINLSSLNDKDARYFMQTVEHHYFDKPLPTSYVERDDPFHHHFRWSLEDDKKLGIFMGYYLLNDLKFFNSEDPDFA